MTTVIDYPFGSMVEQIYKAGKTHSGDIAYEFQGKKTDYQTFISKIDKTAKAFMAMGIGKGDRVTICMPNTPQGVECFYALSRIGAIPTMIHPLSAAAEIEFYVENSKSKAIVTLDMFYEKVEKALSGISRAVPIITARIKDELPFPLNLLYPLTQKPKPKKVDPKTGISWADFLRGGDSIKALPAELPVADDVATILFSGGTTGKTKGIELTNLNMNALALQTGAAAEFSLVGLRMLSVMPLFHGFGLGIGIHTALVFGGTCILVPQFNVKTYAELIKKARPNVLPGVPTLFEALLRTEGLEGFDLSFIRGVFAGGDSLSIELKKKVDQFLKDHNAGVQIREGYGTTECVTASCLTPYDYYKEGSIGLPYPDMTYKMVKPGTIESVPNGEEGEICINGPTVMKGYLDNPEETAQTLRQHEDGKVWLHTGDLGVKDDDGFIYYRQRIKRLIIVSGYNVYPSQVENAMDAHPDVLYSCAIGIKDDYKMQKVKGYVVLRPEVEPSDKIKAEILANCKEVLSPFARPCDIEFRPELPKTLVGKVAYRELEKEVNGEA